MVIKRRRRMGVGFWDGGKEVEMSWEREIGVGIEEGEDVVIGGCD